jgi:branched-chain amino acid transport system permease protein
MTAAPQTTPLATAGETTAASQLVPALRTAIVSALVAFALAFPIISYHAESNIENELVLIPRWPLSFGISALVFAFVFLRQMSSADWRIWFDRFGTAAAGGMGGALVQAAREGEGTAPPSAARVAFGRWFGPFMLGLVIVFPLLMLGMLGPTGSLKWINNYGVQIMIYVMLGWGLNIVVGLAGLLDLGYVAFYAVGAYSYALLSTTFGLSFWICLPLAGLLAAMWGIILGFPVLRLRGDYLAIVTLAFGEIIRLVLINWVDLTNGYAGITSIPHVSFFGIPFNDDDNGFAAIFHIPYSPIYRTIFLFYLILALALLTNWVTLRLRRLPIGRAWEALREDEIACRSLGINTTTTKLTAFALGAMFGGFAGSFFAVRQGFVSPESFTFIESATILAIVVLGGMGSQLGVAIAAAVMIGVPELMRELDWLKAIFGEGFDPTQYRMLLFGAAMVIMMIWKPRGLVSTRLPSVFLKQQKAVSSDLVKEGHG